LVQQRSSQQGAVSGNKSEGQQARESELHEELRRVQAGVRYEPNSTGILMVGGGRDQLGNALVR
jgi:altronate dehydratase